MQGLTVNTNRKVLVIDQQSDLSGFLATLFAEMNWQVMWLSDSQDCDQCVRDWWPDIVVLNADKPELGAIDACEKLRNIWSDLPILLTAEHHSAELAQQAYDKGATDFVSRSMDVDLLRLRMRYLMRASDLIKDLDSRGKRLASAQKIAKLGHWQWDFEDSCFSISQEIAAIFELNTNTFNGRCRLADLLAKVHPMDRSLLNETFVRAKTEKIGFSLEYRLKVGRKEKIIFQEAVVFQENGGDDCILLGTVQDITSRKHAEEKILRLAYYDDLTGLPNRTFLKEHLSLVLESARRNDRCVAILSLDLDHFGRINTSLGHNIGDQLLKCVSDRLISCLRQSDCIARVSANHEMILGNCQVDAIARFDGDNFVILLSEINRPEDAASVAARIIKTVEEPLNVHGNHLVLTATIGISLFPLNGDCIDEILANADAALNFAKTQGRNSFQFFTAEINDIARTRMGLENDLRVALKEGQLELFYQPKVDLQTSTVSGMEALVRWRHPERGLIPPFEFIPLAEETGLIVPLGEWVLNEACRQNAAWLAEGHKDMTVSVNVSARQFAEGTLVKTVTETLRKTGLEPQFLELEITEGILMHDTRMTVRYLRQLQELGVKISLDDFGTGYSSLSYIRNFPIDTLKIDRSFLLNINQDEASLAIVGAIITLAQALGMKIVAEGVEDEATLQLLSCRGCHEIQGYYFSPPIPALEFIDWVKKNGWVDQLNSAIKMVANRS